MVADSLTQFVARPSFTFNICVVVFGVCLCPLCYFSFHNTKYLQYVTLATRNSAFFIMVGLAISRVARGEGLSFQDLPSFDASGLPTLYSSAIYAYMVHHSIPSIITPITHKENLTRIFSLDYLVVWISYVALSWSTVQAFGGIKDTMHRAISFSEVRKSQ